jgi:hypothetical protein
VVSIFLSLHTFCVIINRYSNEGTSFVVCNYQLRNAFMCDEIKYKFLLLLLQSNVPQLHVRRVIIVCSLSQLFIYSGNVIMLRVVSAFIQ